MLEIFPPIIAIGSDKVIPKYIEINCNTILQAISKANQEELAAVREFLIKAAKVTIDIEERNYRVMGGNK